MSPEVFKDADISRHLVGLLTIYCRGPLDLEVHGERPLDLLSTKVLPMFTGESFGDPTFAMFVLVFLHAHHRSRVMFPAQCGS